jgi:hypothetical protein
VVRPGRDANFFSTPIIQSSLVIPITNTLSDPQGDPVRFIRAFYSLDGGGKWYPAVAVSGTRPKYALTTLGNALLSTA